MFNLVNVLSDKDKNLITQYIIRYGVASHFIGADEWLKYWGKEKIKLFKLFGNSFTYTVPFSYEKQPDELQKQLTILMRDNHGFSSCFIDLIFSSDFLYNQKIFEDNTTDRPPYADSEIQTKIRQFCYSCVNNENLAKNKMSKGLTFKLDRCKTTFQSPVGAKPIKAINKFLTYIKPYLADNEDYKELLTKFEKFRLEHSQILNDKIVKGDLVLSIHPLDFMTMSDNDSGWQSCMSWVDDGCYHVGTVEMMNSNNVICCYLKNKKDWNFDFNNKDAVWNNKKWRQLAYITPEIIMTGKAYPYQNEILSHTILNTLDALAQKEWGFNYTYGIEPYNDMKYINTIAAMDRARSYRMLPKSAFHKKNILFDTRGMYNDVLNDHNTTYWCKRNKVNKTTIISTSGKAPCLCCGENKVLKANFDWKEYGETYMHYNDRYTNTGDLICKDCNSKYFSCDWCLNNDTMIEYREFVDPATSETVLLCEHCYKEKVKVCPVCGELLFVHAVGKEGASIKESRNLGYTNMYSILLPLEEKYNDFTLYKENDFDATSEEIPYPSLWSLGSFKERGLSSTYKNFKDFLGDRNYYIPVFGHPGCIEKRFGIKLKDESFSLSRWNRIEQGHCKIVPYNKDNFERFKDFFYSNLKNGASED